MKMYGVEIELNDNGENILFMQRNFDSQNSDDCVIISVDQIDPVIDCLKKLQKESKDMVVGL